MTMTAIVFLRIDLAKNFVDATGRACLVRPSVWHAALLDFKHWVRQLTGRRWGVSMDYRLKKLAQYLRGWLGYFGISQ
jgi:hypothetical protein